MTIREAIVDIWELGGEPSDYDPWYPSTTDYDLETDLDPNSRGVEHYLRQLSKAQRTLSNWRSRGRRPIRFDKFQTRRNARVGLQTQDYDAQRIDTRSIKLISPPSYITPEILQGSKIILTETGISDGDTAEYEQEIEAVLAYYDTGGLNIDLEFREELEDNGLDTVTTTVADIHFNRFKITRSDTRPDDTSELVLPTTFRNISKIIRMDDSGEIFRAESKEALDDFNQSFGAPSEYYDIGETVYFDTYIEEPTWLTVEYQRLPYNLTSLDDEFDIPEQWHDVLIQLVELHTAKLQQDMQKTNMLTASVTRLIDTLRTDAEEKWERTNTNGFYIRREART